MWRGESSMKKRRGNVQFSRESNVAVEDLADYSYSKRKGGETHWYRVTWSAPKILCLALAFVIFASVMHANCPEGPVGSTQQSFLKNNPNCAEAKKQSKNQQRGEIVEGNHRVFCGYVIQPRE
mmetsp:Transcript_29149/g.38850  ORF Transcript_29149/g.38850 Transcript_29149/m.38850 type:complete len:123 (+) Transcript_29149:154-522(+)